MNQEFDEMVRDAMARFTDGADIPDGLAERARGNVHRRRLAQRGSIAAGTAVAAAAVIVAGTLVAGSGSASRHLVARGGSLSSGAAKSVPVRTTAIVISRVDQALTKAAAGNPVAYTQESMHGVKLFVLIPHGRPAEVRGSLTRTWSRGPLQHVEVVSRTGRVMFSTETNLSSGKSVQTMVSYPQQVWWRGTYSAPTSAKPKLACTLGEIDRTPAQWTREVRKLLSCGAAVAGYEQVDGVKTVRLRLSSSYKRACAASNDQRKCTPQPVGWSGVLWANASSYLPVRLVSHGQRFSFRIDFGWLAPNPANLARLHQVIPPGFRHV